MMITALSIKKNWWFLNQPIENNKLVACWTSRKKRHTELVENSELFHSEWRSASSRNKRKCCQMGAKPTAFCPRSVPRSGGWDLWKQIKQVWDMGCQWLFLVPPTYIRLI